MAIPTPLPIFRVGRCAPLFIYSLKPATGQGGGRAMRRFPQNNEMTQHRSSAGSYPSLCCTALEENQHTHLNDLMLHY